MPLLALFRAVRPSMAIWSPTLGSWAYRQQLNVVNSSSVSLSANTTIAVTVDTKTLIGQGKLKSDCSDLRIAYQPSDTTNTVLDRHLVYPGGSSCATSTATKVYFALQASIASAGTSTNYYVYFGNPQATAPSNTDNAFDIGAANALLVCPFEGSTTCAAGETPSTESGAIRYSQGKSALSFDGVNDDVSVGDLTNLDTTFTIEFWAKTDSTTKQQTIFGKDAVGNREFNIDFNVSASGKIDFYGFKSSDLYLYSTNHNLDLNWHYWSVVANGSGVKIYKDGVDLNATLTYGTFGSLLDTSTALLIGRRALQADYYSGLLDEVRISNIARYTANFTAPTTPFVRDEYTKLLLHFDENGDDPRDTGKAIDDSGNGNDGTITGAKYVDGLVGVDSSSSTLQTSTLSSGSYAGREGIFIEEATTNKITNPSFDHGTYNTGWSDASTNWWLAGGISAVNAIAAYQPIGAASLADSYSNLANPGTYDAAPGVAPTWDATSGWIFNGSTQYLRTGVSPNNTYSMIARFSDAAPTTNYSGICGMRNNDSSLYYLFSPRWASESQKLIYNSNFAATATLTTGVWALAGNTAYENGQALSGSGTSNSASGIEAYIGGVNVGGALGFKSPVKFQAFALYDTTITAPQASALSYAMTWLGSGITATENTTAPYYKFGSKSLKLVTTNTGAYVTSVTAGATTHTLSAYVYDGTTGNVGGTVSATVAKLVFNGSAQTTTYTDMGGGWWRLTYSGTASASAVNYGVEVEAGKTIYVDGVQLEEKAYATTYTDGTLGTGYAWTGTAHESTSTRTVTDLEYSKTDNITTTTGSISVWVKSNFNNTSITADAVHLFSTGSHRSSWNHTTIWLSSIQLQMKITDSAGQSMTATWNTTAWSANKWQHLVMTWDESTDTIVGYWNNTSATSTNASYGSANFGTTLQFAGATSADVAGVTYSDFRIYNDNLDATQVSELYNSGLVSRQTTATTVTVDNFTDRATDGIMTNKITNPSFENSSDFDTNWTQQEIWWLAGDISSANAIAAYQPLGATSYATSKINLANPGTYNATEGTAPTWSETTGWTGNGSTTYLNTNFTQPGDQTWSAVAKFANVTSGSVFGGSYYGSSNLEITPPGVTYSHGTANLMTTVTPGIASGILGIAGNKGYRNGVQDATNLTAWTVGATPPMILMGYHFSTPTGNLSRVLNGDLHAVAFYNTVLTGTQMLALQDPISRIGTTPAFISENTTSTYIKSGSKSAKLTNASGTAPVWFYTSINPGNTNTHTLSAYVYTDGTEVTASDAKLIFNGSAVTTTYTSAGSGWWRLTYSAAGVASAGNYGVEVEAGNTAYIDGVQLEESASVTGYIDGSLGTGYQWNGTVNDSTSTRTGSISKGENITSVWHFDEGYGSQVGDGSPNLNHLTLSGATWQTQNSNPQMTNLYFDGTNDYLSRSFDSDFDFGTGAFSISGLFRHPSTVSGTDTLLARQSGSVGYKVYMNSSGYMCFSVNSDSACTTVSYADSKWHSFSAVRSATAITIFIDAVQGGTTAQASPSTVNGNNVLYVGVDSDGASNYWTGFLDDLAIYPYARSASQVKVDNLGVQTAVTLGGRAEDNLTDGLVGWWKMDEASWNGTASEVVDSSGNGNHGTAGNGATTATAKFANGGSFVVGPGASDDDYVTVADASSIQNLPNGDFTVSTYFYDAVASSYPRLIGKGENYTAYGWIILRSQNAIQFIVGGNGTNYITSTTATVNTWHHLVVTYFNADKSAKIYLDGVEASYATATKGSGSYSSDATRNLRFGSWDTNWGLTGKMDDVRIYNRALSVQEVDQLYNWAPGPVAHWSFDEGTGTSAYDSSGNGNTGTLTNGPTWTQGKYGKGLSFDGTDDYVTVPSISSINGSSSLSASAWFKTNSFSSTNMGIVSKYVGQGESSRSWALYIDTQTNGTGDPRISASLSSDGSYEAANTILGSTTLAINTWYYASLSYSSSGATNLYLNGVLQGTDSAPPSSLYSSSKAVLIGLQYYDPGDSNWASALHRGMVDDVRIYNYARSAKQIVSDMLGSTKAVSAGGGTRSAPIAYYKFDEGYGTTANNSGNGGSTLNGTISGATWSNAGKYSKALTFDGSNDYISSSVSGTLLTSLSISVWVKRDPSATTDGLLQWATALGSDVPFVYLRDASGVLTWYVNGNYNVTGGTLTDSVWSHLILTWDGTAWKSYKDSVLVTSYIAGAGIYQANATSFWLANGFAGYWKGNLDEVKIYNYALSAEEVKLDYNGGVAMKLGNLGTDSSNLPSNSSTDSYCPPGQGTTCVAPVAEWNFDEGTGTTINDTSGNGYSGTISGTTNWVAGKVGKALEFDGSTSDITLNSSINLGTVHTISFWAKRKTAGGAEGIVMGFDGGTYALDFTSNKLYYGTSGSITQNWDYTWNANWHFYSVSRNGTSIVLYIDGISQGEKTLGGNLSFSSLNHIGNANHSWHWPGLIDQIKLYNYARTAAQVAWDYNQGKPVAWWRMDETEGTTANNAGSTGSGDNGTLTNGVTLMAEGQYTYAYTFDGSDDFVDVGTGPTVVNSVGFWIKPTTTTEYPIDINGTAYVWINGGTVTAQGFTSPTYYVNGVATVTPTLTAGVWSHVIVTTATALSATDLDLGRIEGVGYLEGQLDDVKVWSYPLTSLQVKNEYNGGAVNFSQ